MANEIIKDESLPVTDNKPTGDVASIETDAAPIKDETANDSTAAPDAEDIDDVVMLLNIMDKQVGGKGEITEVPEEFRGSIGYLVEQLTFVRDLFEDPDWMAILEDMKDQKEDGETPSLMVAIARNIPIEEIQKIAESEDYESAQGELSNKLESSKQAADEDEAYESNFAESQKAGEAYAAEMGYDETRKNELFQKVMDLFTIMGDGKLTRKEFADVDKMLNYGPDTDSLRNQLSTQDAKEVLPDKPSVDATINSNKTPTPQKSRMNTPGMGSMGAYSGGTVDPTQIGKRKRHS